MTTGKRELDMPLANKSQFPQHLIDLYWHRVEELLVNAHGVDRSDAKLGIGRYREVMARSGVGDILYHAGVGRAAEAIATAGYLP